jgi:hypothetical protein
MAIFGAGSKWDNTIEKKDDFFRDENFVIGWGYKESKDLYIATGALKVGDILYLKGNSPGSRSIRIKGIGIVTQNFVECLLNEAKSDLKSGVNFFSIKVKWVVKDEFKIIIPINEGKLTNIRAATFYEEYLPYVNSKIISELLSKIL